MSVSTNNDKKVLEKIDKLTEAINELRINQIQFHSEIKGELNTFKTEINGELNTLKTEIKGELNTVKTEIKGEIKVVNESINGLKNRLENLEVINRVAIGSLFAGIGLAILRYFLDTLKI